jgi:hypothetical protein
MLPRRTLTSAELEIATADPLAISGMITARNRRQHAGETTLLTGDDPRTPQRPGRSPMGTADSVGVTGLEAAVRTGARRMLSSARHWKAADDVISLRSYRGGAAGKSARLDSGISRKAPAELRLSSQVLVRLGRSPHISAARRRLLPRQSCLRAAEGRRCRVSWPPMPSLQRHVLVMLP